MKSLVPSLKSFKGPGKYSEDHEIEINYSEYSGGAEYIGHPRGLVNCAESRIRETETPEPVKPVKRGRRKKNQDPIDPGIPADQAAPDQDPIDPAPETGDQNIIEILSQ